MVYGVVYESFTFPEGMMGSGWFMQAVKCKQPRSGEALQTILGTVAASEDSSEEAQVEGVLYLQVQFVVVQ